MSTVGVQVLLPREDGTRVCGLGVPLTPQDAGGGVLTNMARLVVLLDANLEDLLSYTTATPGVDEVQLVALTGNPTNGSFFLTIPGVGGPTGAIPFDATGGQVQAALLAIPEVGPGDVQVSLLGATYTVSFQGNLGQRPVALMTATDTFNKGGVSVSEQTAGALPGGGISARSSLDPAAKLLLTVTDSSGASWVYRVYPAVNLDSTLITFLGELVEGQPNAWPESAGVYPAAEMEWREATVKYRAPKGAPQPASLSGMPVVTSTPRRGKTR